MTGSCTSSCLLVLIVEVIVTIRRPIGLKGDPTCQSTGLLPPTQRRAFFVKPTSRTLVEFNGAAKEIIMSGIVTLMEVSEPGQGSALDFTIPG